MPGCFLFFRQRLRINHLQRVPLMRWEKTPLYNLKISFLSTRSKTDGKTMEWQRAWSDVMMCSFFPRRVFATTAEAPLRNALPVGTSSQRQFRFLENCEMLEADSPKNNAMGLRSPLVSTPPVFVLPGSAVLGKPARSEGDPQVLEPGEEVVLLASAAVGTSTSSPGPLTLDVLAPRKRSTPKTPRSTW